MKNYNREENEKNSLNYNRLNRLFVMIGTGALIEIGSSLAEKRKRLEFLKYSEKMMGIIDDIVLQKDLSQYKSEDVELFSRKDQNEL
ncbi:hypothetical protein NDK43_23720 [Neobacillus pocheonensis]|uniref:Uncharacterized protein n=1 Tax=Neobacillus pocheonensis TaxID=363869 RepID=A0ABT0WFH4_9BACI|nr:hypothetical protein [Neobacillus pocheonensis]